MRVSENLMLVLPCWLFYFNYAKNLSFYRVINTSGNIMFNDNCKSGIP